MYILEYNINILKYTDLILHILPVTINERKPLPNHNQNWNKLKIENPCPNSWGQSRAGLRLLKDLLGGWWWLVVILIIYKVNIDHPGALYPVLLRTLISVRGLFCVSPEVSEARWVSEPDWREDWLPSWAAPEDANLTKLQPTSGAEEGRDGWGW